MKKCGIHDLERALSANGHFQGIDVREPAEFESERIGAFLSLPLSALGREAAGKLDKNKPLYVLCRSGNRACKAADRLQELGFSDINVIEGGLEAWAQAGKPVVRGSRRVWSLDRQVRFAAGCLVIAGVALSKLAHPYWIGISLFVGAGLVFSGVTDTCGMAMLLARMPWNKSFQRKSCL